MLLLEFMVERETTETSCAQVLVEQAMPDQEMMPDLCWVDVETGGLDPRNSALLEIGCIRETWEGKIKEELSLRIAPYPGLELHPQALAINHIDLRTWDGLPEDRALLTFSHISEGAWCAGYHVVFDILFLMEAFRRHPDLGQLPFWDAAIKGSTVTTEGAAQLKGIPVHGIKSLARAVGIDPTTYQRHTALGDARLARDVYRRIRG